MTSSNPGGTTAKHRGLWEVGIGALMAKNPSIKKLHPLGNRTDVGPISMTECLEGNDLTDGRDGG